MALKPLRQDLSIFNKLELERAPIGIKYEFFRPETVAPYNNVFSLCEIIREAQQSEKPFYISKDNEDCAGKCALGMMQGPVWGEGGEIGERMDIFQDARANRHCVSHYKTFRTGMIHFAVFSRLDQLTFEPDLLVIVSTVDQAEIVLRAMTYSTGEMYESKSTPVFQCSWLYTYPVITQKINYVVTGLSFGMKARQVFPSGLVIVSIPWTWIPTIAANLQEMKFVLPAWTMGREAWMKEEARILDSIDAKMKKSKVDEANPFTSFRT